MRQKAACSLIVVRMTKHLETHNENFTAFVRRILYFFCHRLKNRIQDNLPKDNLPKDNLPKDNLPKDNLPKDNLPKDNLPKDNLPKANLPKIDSGTICRIIFGKLSSRSANWVSAIFFFLYQISWIFVINQVPCVSSCWGKKTHSRGLQRK